MWIFYIVYSNISSIAVKKKMFKSLIIQFGVPMAASRSNTSSLWRTFLWKSAAERILKDLRERSGRAWVYLRVCCYVKSSFKNRWKCWHGQSLGLSALLSTLKHALMIQHFSSSCPSVTLVPNLFLLPTRNTAHAGKHQTNPVV